ncbi:MAG TPA: amidohydrolase family protein [Chloroflexota bacterium]|nr:amidohydrolase family protein [Chloroflexota bacterium]
MDVDKLDAIDVHVHPNLPPPGYTGEATPGQRGGNAPPSAIKFMTYDETAAYYRERKMAFCIFGNDSTPQHPGGGIQTLMEAAERNSDVLIPFAWTDPKRGKDAVEDTKRFIDMGIKGFKFHPPGGGYFPNDEAFYPLYKVIEAAGLPALFHTGQTAVGAGRPGGGGIKLKYGNPMYLDDVAADFPNLSIIMAHPSVPWQDEALSVAVHKPKVYIDLSGWSPKYFPQELVHYGNTLIKGKVLFGSDFPMITPDRWMADLPAANFRDEVKPLIFKENAARLLGLR